MPNHSNPNANASETPVSQQWHVSKGGRQHGPFTSAQVKKLADSGQLQPEDLIWKDGLAEWVAASSVKGLFSAAAIPRTPPPVSKATPIKAHPPDDSQPICDTPRETKEHLAPTPSGRHKQRLGILIAAGLGISATFLPWVHAPIIGSVAGTAGDGWITLLFFIPALIFALRGDSRVPVRGGKRLGLVIPAVLAAILGIWKIISLKTAMSGAADDNPFAKAMSLSVQIGFGLYLLVAAGVAVAVVAWLLDKNTDAQMA